MSSHPLTHFWQLASKELREILRDRRTIITLVFMPILVYPLLGVAFQKFLLTQARSGSQKVEYIIGFENRFDFAQFNQYMAYAELKNGSKSDPKLSALIVQDGKETLEDKLKSLEIDLGVRKLKPEDSNGELELQLVYLENSPASKNAKDFISKQIEEFNRDTLSKIMKENNLSNPDEVHLTDKGVESTQKSSQGISIATIIPLILILMTVTGAVYPAIDLTAGERERGTMETLIAAPIPSMRIMLAKYIAVLAVAMLTAIMNLLAMWTTIYSIGFDSLLLGDTGLSFILIIQVLSLLMLFAGFFSAVLLGITSIARSFKEAQAYLIPLMLVSLSPGILSLMPGIQMNWYLSLTPLINIVLLARDILEDNVSVVPALIAIVSTVFYGYIALHWAAKVFGSDAILYGSPGTWTELWHSKRLDQRGIPTKQAWYSLGLITPLFLLANSIPGRLADASMIQRLGVSATITMTLFLLIPIILNYFLSNPIRKTFALNSSRISYFLAALLLGISVWPFAYELTIYFLPQQQIAELKKHFDSMNIDLKSVPLSWTLLTLAITPAICEEFFFRGYLQNIFSKNNNAFKAILLSAFLFAAFHVIVKSTLSLERFAPSFLLGLILGVVFHQSKSVFPGMILHACHNGLLLSISHFEEFLKKQDWGFNIEAQQHLPAMFLMGAGVVALIGFVILFVGKNNKSYPEAIAANKT